MGIAFRLFSCFGGQLLDLSSRGGNDAGELQSRGDDGVSLVFRFSSTML